MNLGSFVIADQNLKFPRCLFSRHAALDGFTFIPNPYSTWKEGMTATIIDIETCGVEVKTSSQKRILMKNHRYWCKVLTSDGTVGWINSQWVRAL